MTIRHIDGMNYEGVYALALEGWQDLLARGCANDTGLFGWDNKAFVAEEEGVPVGVLIYEHVDWTRSWSVVLGYVKPEHRRQGIYRALWEALVAKAREEKWHHIDGVTAVENVEMRKVMSQLGQEPHSISYRFEL